MTNFCDFQLQGAMWPGSNQLRISLLCIHHYCCGTRQSLLIFDVLLLPRTRWSWKKFSNHRRHSL